MPVCIEMNFKCSWLAIGYIVGDCLGFQPQIASVIVIGLAIWIRTFDALHAVTAHPANFQFNRQRCPWAVRHATHTTPSSGVRTAGADIAAALPIDREAINIVIGVVVALYQQRLRLTQFSGGSTYLWRFSLRAAQQQRTHHAGGGHLKPTAQGVMPIRLG